jgi:hypothetical protein
MGTEGRAALAVEAQALDSSLITPGI